MVDDAKERACRQARRIGTLTGAMQYQWLVNIAMSTNI
jgi:hypothetical protein